MTLLSCGYFSNRQKMKSIGRFIVVVLAMALLSGKDAAAQGIRFQGDVKVTYRGIAWEEYNAGTVSLGARLNEGNYLGIGSGSLWLSRTKRDGNHAPAGEFDVFYSPLYLDYIHYFNAAGAKRSSFFLGAEAGGAVCTNGAARQKYYYHGDLKCGYDFGITKDFGIFVGLDIIAGYAYGIGFSAGFRF